MPLYRAQVILPYFTNLPEDVVVNQFHFFSTNENTDDVALNIRIVLGDFYTTVYGSASNGRVPYVDWPLVRAKVFKLSDPTPRIPVLTTPFGFSNGIGQSTVPTEVACVLSFNAEPQSGVRFQRLYNRIFLGALNSAALSLATVDEFPRFTPAFTAQVATAASTLRSTANTAVLQWQQVSNAGGTTVQRNVVGGWVDNSPDTQRRRSVLATLRNPWT